MQEHAACKLFYKNNLQYISYTLKMCQPENASKTKKI